MYPQLLIVFIITFALAFSLMPFFIRLAKKFKFLDRPSERKIHAHAMPTMGGVVIFLVFIAGISLSRRLNPEFDWLFSDYFLSLFVGGTVILLLGIFHDILDMQPEAKLMGQIIAGLIVFINGIRIEAVTNPFGGQLYLPQWLSMVITVGWVVAIINAVNLIDGLDGLAGGITVVSSAVLFFIALTKKEISSLFIIAALVGSILGFLRYNFYPAKIFMGDAGSMFLGFILSIISILGINKMAAAVALLVPITALGIPIYDTTLAVFRRLVMKRNVMSSDRKHLHYRLLDMGLNQRQVVLFMYAVGIYFGLISYLLARIPIEYSLPLLILFSMGVFLGIKAIGFIERKTRTLHQR